MLFSDAHGRKVVSTSTAEQVGKVDEFVIDAKAHAIVALELKKSDGGDFVRWHDLTAFGPDAVTVPGVEALTDADAELTELGGKAHRVMGKRVLSVGGDELGSVSDLEFDPDTGTVIALVLGSQRIDGVSLIGIGSYAVVVDTTGAPTPRRAVGDPAGPGGADQSA